MGADMTSQSVRSTAPRVGASSSGVWWRVARGLLAFEGAATLYGAVYFTFFASAEAGGDPSGIVEWSIALVAHALAVGLLIAAARLDDRSRRTVTFAMGIVATHVVFSLVKLVGYSETEVVLFLVYDIVLLALLLKLRSSRARA